MSSRPISDGYTETVALAQAHDLLLFVADLGGIGGMHPDGTPIYLGWDNQEPKPIVSIRWSDLALLSRSEVLPRTQPILPRRGPDDPVCPSCGGTGKVELGGKAYDNVVCEYGLGSSTISVCE